MLNKTILIVGLYILSLVIIFSLVMVVKNQYKTNYELKEQNNALLQAKEDYAVYIDGSLKIVNEAQHREDNIHSQTINEIIENGGIYETDEDNYFYIRCNNLFAGMFDCRDETNIKPDQD
jgi:hypothetical protein